MALLIVNLHEIINDYIKNARDKELAGKIASEVPVRSKEVVKKFMFIGEDSCMYHVANLYPMVSRELLWWNRIARRRMKATTSLAHPWQVIIVRNMHKEVFNLLKLTVMQGEYGTVAKNTKCVEKLEITTTEAAIHWMVHVIKDHTAVDESEIFFRLLRNNGYCKAVISCTHPLIIKFSKGQENVKVVFNYGHWNHFGVPQHYI